MGVVGHLNALVQTQKNVAISATFGSFTPQANSVVVLFVGGVNGPAGRIDGGVLTVTGGSLTWTKRTQQGAYAPAYGYSMTLEAWTAEVGATPPTITVGVTGTATSDEDPCRVSLQAVSITGHAVGSPVAQTQKVAIGSQAGAYTFDLAAAPAATSTVIAARNVTPSDTTDTSATPGTSVGYTEIYDSVASGGYGSVASQYRTGSTSTAITWDDLVTAAMTVDMQVAVALEISAEGGGGTTISRAGVCVDGGSAQGRGASSISRAGSECARGGASGVSSVAATRGGSSCASGALRGFGSTATAGMPEVINQTQAFVIWGSGPNTKTTTAIDTTAGSLVLHGVGVWEWFNDESASNQARDRTAPTDSKSNTWSLIGPVSQPDNWPTAAEGVWENFAGTRGTGHTFTKIFGDGSEVVMSVVEVANAGARGDYARYHVANPNASDPVLDLGTVHASGPGRLFVYFYGDQYSTADSTAAGWTLIHEYRATSSSIHQAVFTRVVSDAGDYPCVVSMTGIAQGATAISFLVSPAIADIFIERAGASVSSDFATGRATISAQRFGACVAIGNDASAPAVSRAALGIDVSFGAIVAAGAIGSARAASACASSVPAGAPTSVVAASGREASAIAVIGTGVLGATGDGFGVATGASSLQGGSAVAVTRAGVLTAGDAAGAGSTRSTSGVGLATTAETGLAYGGAGAFASGVGLVGGGGSLLGAPAVVRSALGVDVSYDALAASGAVGVASVAVTCAAGGLGAFAVVATAAAGRATSIGGLVGFGGMGELRDGAGIASGASSLLGTGSVGLFASGVGLASGGSFLQGAGAVALSRLGTSTSAIDAGAGALAALAGIGLATSTDASYAYGGTGAFADGVGLASCGAYLQGSRVPIGPQIIVEGVRRVSTWVAVIGVREL